MKQKLGTEFVRLFVFKQKKREAFLAKVSGGVQRAMTEPDKIENTPYKSKGTPLDTLPPGLNKRSCLSQRAVRMA